MKKVKPFIISIIVIILTYVVLWCGVYFLSEPIYLFYCNSIAKIDPYIGFDYSVIPGKTIDEVTNSYVVIGESYNDDGSVKAQYLQRLDLAAVFDRDAVANLSSRYAIPCVYVTYQNGIAQDAKVHRADEGQFNILNGYGNGSTPESMVDKKSTRQIEKGMTIEEVNAIIGKGKRYNSHLHTFRNRMVYNITEYKLFLIEYRTYFENGKTVLYVHDTYIADEARVLYTFAADALLDQWGLYRFGFRIRIPSWFPFEY